MHSPTLGLTAGTKAVVASVTANVILGASSIYWKALSSFTPLALLCYRILFSLLTLTIILLVKKEALTLVKKISLKLLTVHVFAAAFVVINWGTFIWASIHGHILESGLGYLLAPFVAIAVGKFVLGDKTTTATSIALVIIALTVGYLFNTEGDLTHWVYLTIGITWGGYACLKKWTTLDSFSGLFVETAVLAMLIPLILIVLPVTLSSPAGTSNSELALLGLCGLFSVIPLTLFSFAASRLPLSLMGFFQFILPLTQLFIALAVYRQSTSPGTLLCFSIIGLSLALIMMKSLLDNRNLQKKTSSSH
jgi:chloramphenicol-sensitive protein RarD